MAISAISADIGSRTFLNIHFVPFAAEMFGETAEDRSETGAQRRTRHAPVGESGSTCRPTVPYYLQLCRSVDRLYSASIQAGWPSACRRDTGHNGRPSYSRPPRQ